MVRAIVDDKKFYIDNRLKRNLDKIKKKVTKKDEDYFWAIDGNEGSGKSVLAMQLAKYLDPTFCLDRIVFDGEQFQDAIINAKKGQAIVFDEAFRGLSSRGALTEVNKILVGLMMECRQKNLFVFVVLPTFFLLDKYVALWRAKGLFHVYRKKGKRGQWMYFNNKKKKLLYLKGKTNYVYGEPKSSFRGRFLEEYTVDEDEYRKKKKLALTSISKATGATKLLEERNLILWFLNREMNVSLPDMAKRLKFFGFDRNQSTIGKAVVNAEKRLKQAGVIE